MKLATALAERSDIQNRINTISVRLDNNAKVQEGDVPAEDPKALMEELDRLIVRLEDLVARINLTNSGTVYEGKTITELLAHRDCLKKEGKGIAGFSEYRKRPCHKNDKNRDKNSQHCACVRDTENG